MQTLGCMLFTVSCGWQYADESLRFVGFLFRLLKVFSTRCQFFFLVFVLVYFVFLFCFVLFFLFCGQNLWALLFKFIDHSWQGTFYLWHLMAFRIQLYLEVLCRLLKSFKGPDYCTLNKRPVR